jgi:hypothetical protein
VMASYFTITYELGQQPAITLFHKIIQFDLYST